MKPIPKLPKRLPASRVKILPDLVIFILFLILHSCSLLGPKEQDCYDIGRELTDEEKNIFPYKVGDSVFFTDGDTNYYIYCDRIIDTIYTVNQVGDVHCKGEVDKEDSYVRCYYLKTDIPFYENCKNFGIAVSPTNIDILFYNFQGYVRIGYDTELFMATNRILENLKDNTPENYFQIYFDSIYFNSNWYNNVYQLTYGIRNHCVDTCYINKEHGLIRFNLCTNQKIVLK